MELAVEVGHHLPPLGLALSHVVKLPLDVGREVVVKYLREIFCQEVIDHHAGVGRDELATIASHSLRLDRVQHLPPFEGDDGKIPLLTLAVALDDVFALLDGRDCRGVGRWAAYAQFLKFLDQARLGVARRLLGVTLGRRHLAARQRLPDRHLRECHAGITACVVIVVGFAVDAQEAVKPDHFARCCECLGASLDGYLNVGLVDEGVGHLRGERTFPNQLVEPPLLLRALDVGVLHIGGADCLVSLLRTLGLGREVAGLDIALPHEVDDFLTARGKGKR